MPQLGHEGEGRPRQQNGNDRVLPPAPLGENSLPGRKLPGSVSKEGGPQQQLHQRQHGGNGHQHGSENQNLLGHVNLIRGQQFFFKADALIEPVQCGCKALAVVGCQAVVGSQQLHPPGSALPEAAEGGVPCRLRIVAAQKLRAQIAVEQFLRQKALIIPEIAEFVIFRLEQQHIVEIDSLRIIGALTEQLPALEHRGLGRNIHPRVIGCSRIGGGHRPTGPGSHGVATERQPAGIHIVHGGQRSIRRDSSAGAVGNGISGAVRRVTLIKEGKV